MPRLGTGADSGGLPATTIGVEVMSTDYDVTCDRCGRGEMIPDAELDDHWAGWRPGWWIVWPDFHMPLHEKLQTGGLPTLLICPACYRQSDDEGMSHALQHDPGELALEEEAYHQHIERFGTVPVYTVVLPELD